MNQDVILDHNAIIKLIPHRFPFLMVDKVRGLVPWEQAIGIKAITATEPHLVGHFPDYPIMPGVLIIEAMAQTASVLIAYSSAGKFEGKHVYFTSIDKARFRAPTHPGDVLECHVKYVSNKDTFYKFEGVATHGAVKVATASFSAMIVEPGR